MKKKLLFSIVFSSFLFLFSLPFFVSAAAFPNPPGLFPDWGGGGLANILSTIFNNIYDVFALIIISAGTIGVVVSGYMFIVSSGESGKVASARQILIYSLVGVFVGAISVPLKDWAVSGFRVAQDPIGGVVTNISNWLQLFLVSAGIIGVVVSGYMFISSSGESGKVASARQILIYSLVGVFIGTIALRMSLWAAGGFEGNPIGNAVANIAGWLHLFLISAGVIGIVISGYMFIMSGGESGKVSSARQILIYSLVGVFVGAISVGLVSWANSGFSNDISSITDALGTIANWLFSILIVMAVIGIVVGGYMFITSAGDTQKVSMARNTVIYSLIGVLVAASSWALVAWVRDFF